MHTTRRLAKIRAARRTASAGGVIFIVAMTLAVLMSLGIYALRATATEVKTAGAERQSEQSHYLAEYGTLGAAQVVNGPTAGMFYSVARSNPDQFCSSLYGYGGGTLPSPPPLYLSCRRVGAAELANNASVKINPLVVNFTSGTSPGTLGPVPVNPDFYFELTDPGAGKTPSGYQIGGGGTKACFAQFTITSYGRTVPSGNTLTGGVTVLTAQQMNTGEGMELARSRITAGPLSPCPF